MTSRSVEASIAALQPGDRLADHEEHVSAASICQFTATTGDWYPGHYDPAFARRQGQPGIFLSTLHIHALIDRYVLGHLGDMAFIHRRRMRMRSSIYAESTVAVRGSVLSVDRSAGRATIAVVLECDDQQPVTAAITVGTEP